MELTLSEAFQDTLGQAIANRKLGECHCELGHFDQALKFQQRYLELGKMAESKEEIQRAYATIGRTFFVQVKTI